MNLHACNDDGEDEEEMEKEEVQEVKGSHPAPIVQFF